MPLESREYVEVVESIAEKKQQYLCIICTTTLHSCGMYTYRSVVLAVAIKYYLLPLLFPTEQAFCLFDWRASTILTVLKNKKVGPPARQ